MQTATECGVQVINHAGRSVSQEDGFFTLELSARAPVVELRYPNLVSCTLTMEEGATQGRDVLMVGTVGCPAPLAGP